MTHQLLELAHVTAKWGYSALHFALLGNAEEAGSRARWAVQSANVYLRMGGKAP